MKIAILGATKGIGRALARQLAERGDALFLLGRNATDLEAAAHDLALRAPAGSQAPGHAPCDLEDPASFAPALAEAEKALGGLEAVVVTGGLFGTQDQLEGDAELRRRVLDVDFARTVEFCEVARERLLARPGRWGGRLMVLSSVAGDRGRKPVVLYGAAKAGLSAYLEGLDHRFAASRLQVITVKPGFIRTAMTSGLPEAPFAADPEEIAPALVRALDRGTPVVYVPGIWRLVMLVVRNLPRAVMRRVGF
jgi:NAD(P)-dependent dehydrogenase (short-subunit alcohol dehydrogenase family)